MSRDKIATMKAGGAAIRSLRMDRGMTQAQLGAAIKVTAQAVSAWESGASEPRPRVRPLLAAAFGVGSFSMIYYNAPTVEVVAAPSPLSVRCPTCGAFDGERCAAADGGYLKPSKSHAARKAAAMRGAR